jgi:hypothetical protein
VWSHSEKRLVLCHASVSAGPIPTAFSPDGVYPYESFVETSARPSLQRLHFILLENEFVAAEICPSLGGKVTALWIKRDGVRVANALASPDVVRPVRILPRGAFTGGGIEVSFPISHTPSLLEQVCARPVTVDPSTGRFIVTVGERELKCGMHWTVEYSLGPGDRYLTQHTAFHNPGRAPLPWMSWSNAGVPSRPDTEFHFPGGEVLVHGDEMSTIADWAAATQVAGADSGDARWPPRTQADIARMTAFFWRRPDCGAFGVFTPSLGVGLYHSADLQRVPGIKLWSDGVGVHQRWVTQYMLRSGDQLLEIQVRWGSSGLEIHVRWGSSVLSCGVPTPPALMLLPALLLCVPRRALSLTRASRTGLRQVRRGATPSIGTPQSAL